MTRSQRCLQEGGHVQVRLVLGPVLYVTTLTVCYCCRVPSAVRHSLWSTPLSASCLTTNNALTVGPFIQTANKHRAQTRGCEIKVHCVCVGPHARYILGYSSCSFMSAAILDQRVSVPYVCPRVQMKLSRAVLCLRNVHYKNSSWNYPQWDRVQSHTFLCSSCRTKS